MSPDHTRNPLGDELQEVIRGVNGELVEALPLGSGGYPGYHPSAFRIRLADGRVLKGRLYGNWQRAAAVEYVLQRVHHPGLPRMLARAGRALLKEWVDGRPLVAEEMTSAMLQQCGELLGFIHSAPVPDRNPFERRDPIEEWHRRCERDLAALVHAQALDGGEARRAFELALSHAPSRCVAGFVHRDFCLDNLVLRRSEEICVVDNETLGIDACDFDLGRMWYRWPMSREQREAFFSGYHRRRSAQEFVKHGAYWAIVAVADAAVFRLRKHAQATQAPVVRLRTLLREFDRAADDIALLSY